MVCLFSLTGPPLSVTGRQGLWEKVPLFVDGGDGCEDGVDRSHGLRMPAIGEDERVAGHGNGQTPQTNGLSPPGTRG